MKFGIFTLTTAILVSGCTTYMISEEEIRNKQHKAIKAQAAFEMGCSEDKLLFTDLDTEDANYQNIKVSNKWGVKGCGQKAVYIHIKNHGWVANSKTR